MFDVVALDRNIEINGKYSVTGIGNAAQVMATVLEIINQFVTQRPRVVLYFSAKEPSRIKLYSRMVKKLAGEHKITDRNGKTTFLVFT